MKKFLFFSEPADLLDFNSIFSAFDNLIIITVLEYYVHLTTRISLQEGALIGAIFLPTKRGKSYNKLVIFRVGSSVSELNICPDVERVEQNLGSTI